MDARAIRGKSRVFLYYLFEIGGWWWMARLWSSGVPRRDGSLSKKMSCIWARINNNISESFLMVKSLGRILVPLLGQKVGNVPCRWPSWRHCLGTYLTIGASGGLYCLDAKASAPGTFDNDDGGRLSRVVAWVLVAGSLACLVNYIMSHRTLRDLRGNAGIWRGWLLWKYW